MRTSGLGPDTAVAEPKRWALASVIVASTAALLGTSPDEPSRTRYVFEKTLESLSTELTADAPTQRYVIALSADSLGPDEVVTTTDATARVIGTIRAAGLEEGDEAPFVDVGVLPKNAAENEIRALTSFDASVSLDFAGNCEAPTQGDLPDADATRDVHVSLRARRQSREHPLRLGHSRRPAARQGRAPHASAVSHSTW